ncbi:hypothetical protein PYR66_04140 [Klebsiella aerogenes]|nr:hypothetical protein PYR66_04140 [Klebsiella aerogenes]
MNITHVTQSIKQLENWFRQHSPCTIATSGGIDSMLLAYIASYVIGAEAFIIHSASSAVPDADARRVRLYAEKYNWNYNTVDSGEMHDARYLKNPLNRCYYCKSNLFTRLAHIRRGDIVTGTNVDDLSDYRPGLIAARQNNVQQPYTDLGIDKAAIRRIAAYLQLDDLKELPASPCLASRIETGIAINTSGLQLVDRVESMVKAYLNVDIVRFRIKKMALEIQLAPEFYHSMGEQTRHDLLLAVQQQLPAEFSTMPLNVTAYAQGSAFVGEKQETM